MANLTAVIIPAKALKNSKHKIRIALSHNSQVRYIVTDLLVENVNEFKNGSFRNRPDAAYLNTKLRKLMQRYQETLDEIEYIEGLTCAELIYLLKNGTVNKYRTLGSIFDEYLDVVVKTEGSKRAYTTRFHSIEKFLTRDILMQKINHGTVLGFIKYMEDKGLSQMTIRMRSLFLKTLINYSIKCGYCEYKVHPFNGVPLPDDVIRQAWLTVDEIKAIRDCTPKSIKERRSRDLFMLSYYLGGINLTDLMNINFKESKKTIKYLRQKTLRANKTKQYVEFEIPQEAIDIIKDMKLDKYGRIELTERERRLVCTDLLRVGLKKLSADLGINKIIYYSARKSFAQHAFYLGVSVSTIDYILGHSTSKGGTSLYHYIMVTPEIASKAVRLVLDNLKK